MWVTETVVSPAKLDDCGELVEYENEMSQGSH